MKKVDKKMVLNALAVSCVAAAAVLAICLIKKQEKIRKRAQEQGQQERREKAADKSIEHTAPGMPLSQPTPELEEVTNAFDRVPSDIDPVRLTLRDGREVEIRLMKRKLSPAHHVSQSYARFARGITSMYSSRYYWPLEHFEHRAALRRVRTGLLMANSCMHHAAPCRSTPLPLNFCELALHLYDDKGEIQGEGGFQWDPIWNHCFFFLCISKEFQGVGAGRALANQVMRAFDKGYGPDLMKLEVQKENERAWKLYESLGFEKTSEDVRPARSDCPALPQYQMQRARLQKTLDDVL